MEEELDIFKNAEVISVNVKRETAYIKIIDRMELKLEDGSIKVIENFDVFRSIFPSIEIGSKGDFTIAYAKYGKRRDLPPVKTAFLLSSTAGGIKRTTDFELITSAIKSSQITYSNFLLHTFDVIMKGGFATLVLWVVGGVISLGFFPALLLVLMLIFAMIGTPLCQKELTKIETYKKYLIENGFTL